LQEVYHRKMKRAAGFSTVKGAPAPGGQRIGKALPLTAIPNEQKIVWG
jgi:hypothetical protein